MTKLSCVIIDDEPLAIKIIQEYGSKFPQLAIQGVFLNAIAGKTFLLKNKIDLLFLDIQMPDITGIQLLQSLQDPPMVIFTTAYSKYAIDGYDMNIIDYLLKPIEFNRFEKAITKAINFHQLNQKADSNVCKTIFVRSDYQLVNIELSKIEYIESLDDYIKIYLENKSSITTLMPLKKMLEKIPPSDFIRVHRSYIVPIKKIISIANRKIELNTTQIPIGESYIPSLNKILKF